ncbi:MAG: hypothetical protein C5B49_14675 [Bdellovibrio sp.]|nr:MAG: hypothetical protein C5B49_14675 [Bdellovibrio sp.]
MKIRLLHIQRRNITTLVIPLSFLACSFLFQSYVHAVHTGSAKIRDSVGNATEEVRYGPRANMRRVHEQSSKLPWIVAGQISGGTKEGCTGALVGEAGVLTALECVAKSDRTGVIKEGLTFRIWNYGSKKYEVAKVVGVFPGDNALAKNRSRSIAKPTSAWAYLRLERDLGMAPLLCNPANSVQLTENFGKEKIPPGFFGLIGFYSDLGEIESGTSTSSLIRGGEEGCDVTGVDNNGLITHNCTTTRGTLGAPLIWHDPRTGDDGVWVIVALNVSGGVEDEFAESEEFTIADGIESSERKDNLAIPASEFCKFIKNKNLDWRKMAAQDAAPAQSATTGHKRRKVSER